MEHGPLYEQQIQEIKERRIKVTIIVVLVAVVIYWVFFNDGDRKTYHISQQEAPKEMGQSSFVDSASNAIKVKMERPDTYQLLEYKDTVMIYKNSFRVAIKFRCKDWKEQYHVAETNVWLDSNKHIQEIRVIKEE